MFRFLAILASIVGSSAFTPSRVSRSSALKMSYENELGALPPVGFWDPLGLSKNIDEETFKKYRTAELKHGRVCQLAVLGYVVPEIVRFPGSIGGVNFADIPNGVQALSVVPAFGAFQIAASIGFWEIYGWKQVEGSTPGDFGYGAEYVKDEAALAEKKTKELQNGRLAMLAAAELIRHDFQLQSGIFPNDHLITGLPFLYGN